MPHLYQGTLDTHNDKRTGTTRYRGIHFTVFNKGKESVNPLLRTYLVAPVIFMCQVTVVDHALQPLTFLRMYNSNNSCEEKGLGLYPGWFL